MSKAVSGYRKYNDYLYRSAVFVFRNFIKDELEPVSEYTPAKKLILTSVDVVGTLKGELLFRFPKETIGKIAERMIPGLKKKNAALLEDVACELSNMVTGTFVNHLQFLKHELEVLPPEILDGDEEYVRTLYDSVNLSFQGQVGFFDIDFYFKEKN